MAGGGSLTVRRNMDEELRRIERETAAGGRESRLLVARMRAGSLDLEHVELAAVLGDEIARQAIPEWRASIRPTWVDQLRTDAQVELRADHVSYAASLLRFAISAGPAIARVIYDRGVERSAPRTSGTASPEWTDALERATDLVIVREEFGSGFGALRNLASLSAETHAAQDEAWARELEAQRADLIALLLDRPLSPTMRRNMADDQLRSLERGYLATPADSALLGRLLRVVARARGGAPSMIVWIDTLWRNNGLTPDHVDLDVLSEAAFESSSYSEDLRQNLEAVERIALAADASDLEDVHSDDRDEDQRAPWWRRERFHDLDFDRRHPHKGGRLYSPARGAFLTVSEIKRSRGKNKSPESRGWLLVENPIERLAYGVDAVLVDMAQGPVATRAPISTWLLRRVLGAASGATTLSPRKGQTLAPFAHAVFVTDMREDPTDVVEKLAGAPAAPLGGAPRTHTGRGPMTGLWEGALGRPGRVEVMRASDASRMLDTALYQWRVAQHPYRVRLDELRANYHEERGGESLSLIWVGRGKRPDSTDGVAIMAWSNENTDPVTEEFEWGEPIADQLDLDETNDWTSGAARAAHDAEAIVVEEWEAPPEREGPYELGNLLVTGMTCNERFSIGNEGEITVGGDRGDVRALSAVNVGGDVLLHDARLITTETGLTDDEAAELAVEIISASWESVGEDTFNQTRRR